MHKFQAPLARFALLRSLSPAARLIGAIGAALLVCSCSGGGSSGAATTSQSTVTTAPSTTTPSAGATESPPTTTPPPAGQVRLAWDAVSTPDLAGYRLYYGHTPQTYAAQIDVGAQTTYTVTGLSAGQTYYFVVTAYNHLGNESPFSNEVNTPIAAAVSTAMTATAAVGASSANVTSGQALSPAYASFARRQSALPLPLREALTGGEGPPRLVKAPHPTLLPPGEGQDGTEHNQLHTILEVGELTVDDLWQRVTFRRPFVDPIVVATPLGANDLAPATVRIRNVEPAGFEIRVQTWDDLDGRHALETVSYLAMERGPHRLGTGIRIEAGRLRTPAHPTQPFTPVALRQAFAAAPVVLTAVTSINAAAAVTTRVRHVTAQSFQVRMQEQSGSMPSQTTETIDYIAWEPSSGTVDGLTFEVHTTPHAVTDRLYTLRLMQHFLAVPRFLAAMQTTNGEAPGILRWDNKDTVSVEILIQGDASAGHDLHPTEVVGYMALTYE